MINPPIYFAVIERATLKTVRILPSAVEAKLYIKRSPDFYQIERCFVQSYAEDPNKSLLAFIDRPDYSTFTELLRYKKLEVVFHKNRKGRARIGPLAPKEFAPIPPLPSPSGDLPRRKKENSEMTYKVTGMKVRTKITIISLSALLLSTSCAGRPPQQISVVQPQDRYYDCLALSAEISSNDQKLQLLHSEQSNKVTQNVAAGIAGVFIWPLWFAMDFQGAASQDAEAIGSRQQYLESLAAQNRCYGSTVK